MKRTLVLGSRIPTSLPIAVNVHDFFRGSRYVHMVHKPTHLSLKRNCNRLFSKFTISTAAYQHVRLASANLELSEEDAHGLVVRGTLPQRRDITVMHLYSENVSGLITLQTITPSRPVNVVFQMDSMNGRGEHDVYTLPPYNIR